MEKPSSPGLAGDETRMKVAARDSSSGESKRVDFSCRRRESVGRTQREMKDLPARAAQAVNGRPAADALRGVCAGASRFDSQISDSE